MTDTYVGTLYGKLAEIVAEVGGVEKDGFNTFHKYNYTSAEAMLRAIRGPLAARKIALLPSVSEVAEREITTSKGNVSTVTTVRVTFTFADGESGETHSCEWAGQGDDPADKGLGKAYTNAVKTFLREVFLIPQGDDPEADSRTDERASQRVARPSQPARVPVAREPRRLTEEERERVLEAVGAAGQRLSHVLAECEIASLDEMTVADARKVRKWLDDLVPPDVPAPIEALEAPDVAAIADEMFGAAA